MVATSIQTGNRANSSFVKSVSRVVALATVLLAGAGIAQAADSNDRIVPPSPADVAMLRSLLALQHPTLRQIGATTSMPASTVPTVGSEPSQQSGQTS